MYALSVPIWRVVVDKSQTDCRQVVSRLVVRRVENSSGHERFLSSSQVSDALDVAFLERKKVSNELYEKMKGSPKSST